MRESGPVILFADPEADDQRHHHRGQSAECEATLEHQDRRHLGHELAADERVEAVAGSDPAHADVDRQVLATVVHAAERVGERHRTAR